MTQLVQTQNNLPQPNSNEARDNETQGVNGDSRTARDIAINNAVAAGSFISNAARFAANPLSFFQNPGAGANPLEALLNLAMPPAPQANQATANANQPTNVTNSTPAPQLPVSADPVNNAVADIFKSQNALAGKAFSTRQVQENLGLFAQDLQAGYDHYYGMCVWQVHNDIVKGRAAKNETAVRLQAYQSAAGQIGEYGSEQSWESYRRFVQAGELPAQMQRALFPRPDLRTGENAIPQRQLEQIRDYLTSDYVGQGANPKDQTPYEMRGPLHRAGILDVQSAFNVSANNKYQGYFDNKSAAESLVAQRVAAAQAAAHQQAQAASQPAGSRNGGGAASANPVNPMNGASNPSGGNLGAGSATQRAASAPADSPDIGGAGGASPSVRNSMPTGLPVGQQGAADAYNVANALNLKAYDFSLNREDRDSKYWADLNDGSKLLKYSFIEKDNKIHLIRTARNANDGQAEITDLSLSGVNRTWTQINADVLNGSKQLPIRELFKMKQLPQGAS